MARRKKKAKAELPPKPVACKPFKLDKRSKPLAQAQRALAILSETCDGMVLHAIATGLGSVVIRAVTRIVSETRL